MTRNASTLRQKNFNECKNTFIYFNSNKELLNRKLICSKVLFNAHRRWLHRTPASSVKFTGDQSRNDPQENRLTRQGYFKSSTRNKETFLTTLRLYKAKEKLLRGHVEFIYTAMRHMEEFGVHKDLEVYKEVMDVFPKLKMVPNNLFQVEFMHYPHHQDCALDLLCKMEDNGVIPDSEMGELIYAVFGRHGFPYKKFLRMVYWMNKFTNASPWPLPKPIPNDSFLLAKLAVERMCTVDHTSEIVVFQTKQLQDSIDDTWIVSGQSFHQKELLDKQPSGEPLKVEGPFRIYLREQCVNYFVLKADARPQQKVENIDVDDIGEISKLLELDGTLKANTAVTVQPSVHEQADGTILALCVTGTSSRDSLLSWIRFLGRTNPKLDAGLPVVFLQSSPDQFNEIMPMSGQKQPASEVLANNKTAPQSITSGSDDKQDNNR